MTDDYSTFTASPKTSKTPLMNKLKLLNACNAKLLTDDVVAEKQ